MKLPRTCVAPDGTFIVGVHKPSFEVKNFRERNHIYPLGQLVDGTTIENHANFPEQDLTEPGADIIYEIANAFPFRGTTYINTAWADAKARDPESIGIAPPPECSFLNSMKEFCGHSNRETEKTPPETLINILPRPLLLALAQASTDPEELVLLARKSCRIIFDDTSGAPVGIGYKTGGNGRVIPDIFDHDLFEVLVNNRYLPDDYKNTLVLKPGVQGNNEITGDYLAGSTHVFEYLRRNSYIPWGHFASNMANDAIRYRARDLGVEDMKGIRHLYYQRIYARLAGQLGIDLPSEKQGLSQNRLEELRKKIFDAIAYEKKDTLEFNCALWGWNYGFGFAQSGHRLHASHQMIHQQNAMIPKTVTTQTTDSRPSFAPGDMIAEFIEQYEKACGQPFFDAYLNAIRNNTRTDGKDSGESSLTVFEDENIILFVPKAPISEWELQLMPKSSAGNILEADDQMRDSIDKGIVYAVKTLDLMGAQMVTGIEFSKRFDDMKQSQHLLYSFIPKLPYAPGTFSEAQYRWICGCYPEDVAARCRMTLQSFI